MQPGFDVPCASARLQNPAAALLLSLSAPVKNVLNSSHDSFLFAFDRVLLPFPGRKRRPPKKNPDTMKAVSFFPLRFFFSGTWKHPPACRFCFSPRRGLWLQSRPRRMSVSGVACSKQNKISKQKSIMTSLCLFAVFTATRRCSRLGQTE